MVENHGEDLACRNSCKSRAKMVKNGQITQYIVSPDSSSPTSIFLTHNFEERKTPLGLSRTPVVPTGKTGGNK